MHSFLVTSVAGRLIYINHCSAWYMASNGPWLVRGGLISWSLEASLLFSWSEFMFWNEKHLLTGGRFPSLVRLSDGKADWLHIT